MNINVPLRPGVDRLPSAPLALPGEAVRPEWIDYNGHMNVAYYVLAFDHATDRLLDLLDLGADYVGRENMSFFVLETHVRYLREVRLGDSMAFTLHLIDSDAKRLHYYLEMRHAGKGFLAATSEQLGMHIDLEARKSAPFPAAAAERIAAIAAAHAALPRPDGVGASIAIRRAD